ncbi:MAG: osmotically inducible protein OsmC [Anaerolineae bacterium]|nr:osmotically inducible protein OsmC [Anaerolineae bacterium]
MKESNAQVKWLDKLEFVGTDSTKHSLVMSSQDEENATGLKPSDLLLLALAGCTAVDVVTIMRKKRQAMTGLEINVRGEQDEDPPWTFRHIHLEYVVRGKGLSEKGLAQAIQLSEEKYCSVKTSLACPVTSSYRIVEEE